MKLLFDQLADTFQPEFPGSTHILRVNLSNALDEAVWGYARVHGFTIVTKDSDYLELALLRGRPPKIILGSSRKLYDCGNRVTVPEGIGSYKLVP